MYPFVIKGEGAFWTTWYIYISIYFHKKHDTYLSAHLHSSHLSIYLSHIPQRRNLKQNLAALSTVPMLKYLEPNLGSCTQTNVGKSCLHSKGVLVCFVAPWLEKESSTLPLDYSNSVHEQTYKLLRDLSCLSSPTWDG